MRLPTIRLRGGLDDPTVGFVTVLINDNEMTLSVTDRKFEGMLTLVEGINRITVRAVDAAGNVGSKSITGRYERAPPMLENVDAVVRGVLKRFTFGHPFVLEIRVMPRENADALKIVVETVDDLGGISPPVGIGYAYVKLSSAPPGIIENAEVLFAVEYDWVRPLFIEHCTVKFYRYVDGGWEALKTSVVRHTETTIEYLAEVPGGFSLFAISGEPIPEKLVTDALLPLLAVLLATGVATGALAGWLSVRVRGRIPKRGWTPWG